MTNLKPGVKREDLVPANDPGEGLRIAQEAARQPKAVYGERLRQHDLVRIMGHRRGA